jgi:beta-N-acetylhexosaminidase
MTLRKARVTSKLTRLMHVVLVVQFLIGALQLGEVTAGDSLISAQAETLVAQMTPEEKVGQLFLITFDGTDIAEGSDIYDLIVNHHIGGVILGADMNNFVSEDTTAAAYQLTTGLQELAWQESNPTEGEIIEDNPPTYVPLFIGIAQEGNGSPSDQILNGLTPLPSQMTIGATWNPQLAQEVGQVMGSELAALGFNFYLGPSLDVVDTSNSENAYYSGTQTFGGDPYWVGELGKAYISGLHLGSDGKLAVISKHFPGQGSTDRSPEDEVATVRKSLEQLKQIELAPFIAVTNSTSATESQTDGLMISHIRYQGFQGNIRATTRPVSFDNTALSQLMALESFSSWRTNGGLIVSDSLGSHAVRRFFDPIGETFDAPQIARTAFQAGNDLLYLKDFIATNDPDAYTTVLDTLDFFVQKYQEDTVFAQRVDDSVLRIINSKLKLYGEFELENVIPSEDELNSLGNGSQTSLKVAREAVTLISPAESDLETILLEEPSTYEYMIIFSDVRSSQQCSTCEPTSMLSNWSLQNSLLQLYGPAGSNQIQQSRLSSYTFGQLLEVLDTKTEPSDPNLMDNLKRANWVIFNIMDINSAYPGSEALKRILSERVDLLRDKKVIVFAFDTPFYLDATEISEVTAYYGLFSKVPASVEVAARVLMREIKPQGALPVSVSSVRYDLITATSPDPNQIIQLNLVKPAANGTPTPTVEATSEETEPMLGIGESVEIEAGVILDRNQNPVPDGTVVRFTFWSVDDSVITQQQESVTISGKARLSYRIDRGGTLEVTAVSEPATISSKLLLNIESGIAEVIMPTATPAPTATPTLEPTPTTTLTPTSEASTTIEPSGYPNLTDWLLAVLLVLGGFGVAYLLGYFWWGSVRWGLRSGLCAALGGLLAYVLLNLGFPGMMAWVKQAGSSFVLQTVFIGLMLGWIAALIWWVLVDGNKIPPKKQQP